MILENMLLYTFLSYETKSRELLVFSLISLISGSTFSRKCGYILIICKYLILEYKMFPD